MYFVDVAQQALMWAFTRDPFDRLITAHAALHKAPLITLEATIRKHYPQAMQ